MPSTRLDLLAALTISATLVFAGNEKILPQPRISEPPVISKREVPAKAAAEFRKAQQAMEEGKIDRAVKLLRNGIALDPSNTDAYNDLGVIYFNLREPEKALEAFSSMIEIDPRCFRAYVNVAFILNSQQRFQDAERAARNAIDLKKMDLKARYLLGVALASQKKNLDEAAENLSIAAEEFSEARLELSRMYIEKGDFDRAMKELQLFTQQSNLAGKAGMTPAQLFAK